MQDKGLTKFPEVKEFADQLYESGCKSPHLIGFMIDVIEESLLVNQDQELCKKAIDVSFISFASIYFLLYYFFCIENSRIQYLY